MTYRELTNSATGSSWPGTISIKKSNISFLLMAIAISSFVTVRRLDALAIKNERTVISLMKTEKWHPNVCEKQDCSQLFKVMRC